eukprot:6206845-Pleurochrysis_carterae.AAC.1
MMLTFNCPQSRKLNALVDLSMRKRIGSGDKTKTGLLELDLHGHVVTELKAPVRNRIWQAMAHRQYANR